MLAELHEGERVRRDREFASLGLPCRITHDSSKALLDVAGPEPARKASYGLPTIHPELDELREATESLSKKPLQATRRVGPGPTVLDSSEGHAVV